MLKFIELKLYPYLIRKEELTMLRRKYRFNKFKFFRFIGLTIYLLFTFTNGFSGHKYNSTNTIVMNNNVMTTEENSSTSYLEKNDLVFNKRFYTLKIDKLSKKYEEVAKKQSKVEPDTKYVECINGSMKSNISVEYFSGKEGIKDERTSKIVTKPKSRLVAVRKNSRGKDISDYRLSLFDFPKTLDKKYIKKTLKVKTTVYDPYKCTKAGKGISKSGIPILKGARAVATDPKVIPLGSLIYIEDPDGSKAHSGYFVSVDIGKKVIGNVIDIVRWDDVLICKKDVTVHIMDYRRMPFYSKR
ncbi:MAG: 3D domain-containing protein [Clostridia bacterium]|nr:3D domain-containing protein [Clostridia bacterium]